MSTVTQLFEDGEFLSDFVYFKFANLQRPVGVPFTEVAAGRLDPDRCSGEDIVIFTQNKAPGEDPGESATTYSKENLLSYFNAKLKPPADGDYADYGEIEDFCLQPAGADALPSVLDFHKRFA